MDEHNEQMTLAEIIRIHDTQHAGFRWQCRRDVKGTECRHIYLNALEDADEEAQRTHPAAEQQRERG